MRPIGNCRLTGSPTIFCAAPTSGIVALIGIDSDQLRVMLDHTEVAQGRRRALFLSFDRSTGRRYDRRADRRRIGGYRDADVACLV